MGDISVQTPMVGTGPFYTADIVAMIDSATHVDGSVTANKLGLNSVTTNKILARAITFAKTQAIATGVILGRSSSGSGDIEELSASSARTVLGLGDSATLSVGTTTGTVAAGDDSRITGAAQKASNLSDLASASTARTNLGLATVASSGDYNDLENAPDISTVSANTIVANATDSEAAPTAITLADGLAFVSSKLSQVGCSFSASNTSGASIPSGVNTELVFANVIDNTNSCYNSTTGRFTADKTGLYSFGAQVRQTTTANETFTLSILKNGTTYLIATRKYVYTDITITCPTVDVRLTAGDYVSLWAYQDSGSGKSITTEQGINRFWGHFVRP